MSYDLFISYSRRDNEQGRITQLVERIKTDFAPFAKRELTPFFDQQEIHGMSDWRQRILQGLRESRLLLACLSPAYLQSEYCEWEFVEYLKYEIGHLHGFNGVAPIYFVEVPGWESKDFEQQCAAWVAELRKRQHFDLRPWNDRGEEALREAAVQERMGKLNRQIVQTITRGERAEKSLGNVDAHNPHFIGRTANLRMLRENFVTPGHIGVVTAVNGVGGLGKTALAIEYAHAFADEYGGGRWQVRCAGKDDLRLALAELATPIGFEFTDEEKTNADLQFERTRRELKRLADAREPHRCLLILDNVDKPSLLEPAMVARVNAGDWLHILATTRLGENELHGSHKDRSFLAVDELPPDDALALIESYQPNGHFRSEAERDAAHEIVRLLGCFTLAVESAAVYLGQFANDVTCAAFLARLKKEGLEGLDTAAVQSSEGVLHGEKRLSATLQPTLERLGAPEKLALEFAALLPPDQVPLPWLRTLVAKTFPEMERDAEPGYPDPWNNVLRCLFSLRLLQPTVAADAGLQPLLVRVHRLIQQAVKGKFTDDAAQKLDEIIALAFERSEHLESSWHKPADRWEANPLILVVRSLLDARHPESVRLLKWLSEWIWIANIISPRDFEALLRQALALQESDPATEPTEIAITLNNLAVPLASQFHYDDAEAVLRRALAVDEEHRERNHPFIAIRLHVLGQLLFFRDRFEESEGYIRRALAIREEVYGPDHLLVASTLGSLFVVLYTLNRYLEAEPVLRRALEIEERHLDANHPSIATSLNNLAELLQDTNRSQEAEPLFRRAIEIDEHVYGPEHHQVAHALNNLAELLRNNGRLSEAEALHLRALHNREKGLGPDHPDVANSLNNLGLIYKATNRGDDAESCLRRSLAIREKAWGPDHTEVAHALNNLGVILKERNRFEEAESLLTRAVSIREKRLGPEHPAVAMSLHKLAQLTQATNRMGEAESLYRRALAIREKALVPDHADTLDSMEAVAELLEATGRLEEAAALRRRALEARERKLGPEHPDTLRGLLWHCIALRKQGHAGQAEPIDRRVAITTAKMLGDTHPLTLHRRNNLVLTLIMLGKLEEARQILAANWRLNALPHGNTTPRIAFLRHLIAVLESQPDTPFLGHLKTLLTGPELPVASDVAVPWDIAYFIKFLRPKLGEQPAEFLTALVAALNDRAKLSALDPFPEWRDQSLIPLDAPWPD